MFQKRIDVIQILIMRFPDLIAWLYKYKKINKYINYRLNSFSLLKANIYIETDFEHNKYYKPNMSDKLAGERT